MGFSELSFVFSLEKKLEFRLYNLESRLYFKKPSSHPANKQFPRKKAKFINRSLNSSLSVWGQTILKQMPRILFTSNFDIIFFFSHSSISKTTLVSFCLSLIIFFSSFEIFTMALFQSRTLICLKILLLNTNVNFYR